MRAAPGHGKVGEIEQKAADAASRRGSEGLWIEEEGWRGVRGCVVKVRVINKIGRGLHLSMTNHWMKDGGGGEGVVLAEIV